MTYQERKNIVNMISSLLITGIYALIIYKRHLAGLFDLTTDYSKWGIIFLVFIGVSIAARIIIYIIFHIVNAIATREEDIPVTDERDKLIGLKATRNAYITFSVGFAMSIVFLSFGLTPVFLFVAFVVFGLLADIVDNSSQIYYYRKGV